jgi:hypothetical protein
VTRPGSRFIAVVLALPFVLTACGVSGLNFKQDKRLTITAPTDRSRVGLPLTVRWEVDDFSVTGRDGSRRADAGYFGVYLDRAPQPPERKQDWLLRDEPRCRGNTTCSSPGVLADARIYSTSETSLTLDNIADLDPESDRRDIHEVTVVLLNGRGERIGESAFIVEFEIERVA